MSILVDVVQLLADAATSLQRSVAGGGHINRRRETGGDEAEESDKGKSELHYD